MSSLLAALDKTKLDRVRSSLALLGSAPPQSLLLEGGTELERLQMGQYWAMLANCPSALASLANGEEPKPCLSCAICRKIAAFEFSDLYIFDGRISNTEDAENPGHIRSLRMENIRNLKLVLGSAPNGEGKRIVIIQGMSQTREEAMNSLLKILEEPSKSTLFVLLCSQREQILPTLVSRSLCLSLPWTDCFSPPVEEMPFLDDFARFLESGSIFMDKIIQKGAMDAALAAALLLECQKALGRILTGVVSGRPLDKSLYPLAANPQAVGQAYAWLNEAHNLLQATVNPVRVVEAFASKLYGLVHG